MDADVVNPVGDGGEVSVVGIVVIVVEEVVVDVRRFVVVLIVVEVEVVVVVVNVHGWKVVIPIFGVVVVGVVMVVGRLAALEVWVESVWTSVARQDFRIHRGGCGSGRMVLARMIVLGVVHLLRLGVVRRTAV